MNMFRRDRLGTPASVEMRDGEYYISVRKDHANLLNLILDEDNPQYKVESIKFVQKIDSKTYLSIVCYEGSLRRDLEYEVTYSTSGKPQSIGVEYKLTKSGDAPIALKAFSFDTSVPDSKVTTTTSVSKAESGNEVGRNFLEKGDYRVHFVNPKDLKDWEKYQFKHKDILRNWIEANPDGTYILFVVEQDTDNRVVISEFKIGIGGIYSFSDPLFYVDGDGLAHLIEYKSYKVERPKEPEPEVVYRRRVVTTRRSSGGKYKGASSGGSASSSSGKPSKRNLQGFSQRAAADTQRYNDGHGEAFNPRPSGHLDPENPGNVIYKVDDPETQTRVDYSLPISDIYKDEDEKLTDSQVSNRVREHFDNSKGSK